MKKQFTGSFEYKGAEYDYTAVIYSGDDSYTYPDQITDLDRTDGESLEEGIWEDVEFAALQNAYLVEWREQDGWEEEDTGGGCSALIRAPQGFVWRITKANDPSVPQTMGEPIIVGLYNLKDELIGETQTFAGGIDEWIASDDTKVRPAIKEPVSVLKEGVIYIADNGMAICLKCAGQSALFTGRDISGQEVCAVPRSINKKWRERTGEDMACEKGCTRYGES